MPSQKELELVLLIHGTGAGSPFDEGVAWWQRDSDFWLRMHKRFEGIAEIQPLGNVFHWSGANSEIERRAGGTVLFQKLQQLEESGRTYHLIGHSHGGSVIWHALKNSAKFGQELPGLKSWATVATPFIHVTPKPFDYWSSVPLIVAAIAGFVSLGMIGPFTQSFSEMWDLGEKTTTLLLPLFWFLIFAVGGGLAVNAIRLLRSRWRIDADGESAKLAYSWYAARWLAVWSSEDEAINGLVNTVSASGQIIPRSHPDSPGTREAIWTKIMIPFRALYDRVLAAAGDTFIWNQLKERAQGNDLHGARVISVSQGPLLGEQYWTKLPEKVHGRLKEMADKNAARFLGELRTSFGLNAEERHGLSSMVERMKAGLTFTELIHTSYFDLDDIGDILSLHVGQHLKTKFEIGGNENAPHVLDWIAEGMQEPVTGAESGRAGKIYNTSALRFLTNCAIAAIIGIVSLSVNTLNDNVVLEYTADFQVEDILKTTPIRIVSAVGNADVIVADSTYSWFSALVRVDHLPNALEQANWFAGEVADNAFTVILIELLRLGKESEAAQLIRDYPSRLLESAAVFHIAKWLTGAENLDALRMLASIVSDLNSGSFNYDPSEIVQIASTQLADAGRVEEAIKLARDAPDQLNKDDIWAAIASRVAASGKAAEAFELTSYVNEPVRKLVSYESILEFGKPDNDIVAEISKDVVLIFEEESNCKSPEIDPHFGHHGIHTYERFRKWVVLLIKNTRLDAAARLGELCAEPNGFGELASYFLEKGKLPSADAIDRIAAKISRGTNPSEAFALLGFIDDALAIHPLFKDGFLDNTRTALVIPLIDAGRLKDLQRIIGEETNEYVKDNMNYIAFKRFLFMGEMDHAFGVSEQNDWSEQLSRDFSEIAERVRPNTGDDGSSHLMAIIEQQSKTSNSNLSRLRFAAVRFGISVASAPEQQWFESGNKLLDAAREYELELPDSSSSQIVRSSIADMAKFGYVDEAEQIVDSLIEISSLEITHYGIAKEHLRKANIESADRLFNKSGVAGWNDIDFSIIANLLEDEGILNQVKLDLEKVIGSDSYRTGFNFNFADTLISIGRVDQAVEYVDLIEGSEEKKDALLIRCIEQLFSSKQFDVIGECISRIETDEGQRDSFRLLTALADGGREPYHTPSGSLLEDFSPNLEEAKKFVAFMPGAALKASAYAYLAGAARRSGAANSEVLGLLAEAEINAANVANPDEVMPDIARQYAGLGRLKTAAAICRRCSPDATVMANAMILNEISVAKTGIVIDEIDIGFYGLQQ